MFDIIGYWVMASVLILPLICLPGYLIADHFNDILEDNTRCRHRIQSFVWVKRNCPEWLAMAVVVLGIFEWIFFIITTLHYYIAGDEKHDYLLAVNHLSEMLAPIAAWAVVVVCFFVAIHYAVVGYAKVLNMGDKLKDKEKKHV